MRLIIRPPTRECRYALLPLLLLSAFQSMAMLGCAGDTATNLRTIQVSSDPNAYWALQLNQHAVNMALTGSSNTMQLTATPVTASGTPLASAGPVTYTATDSTVSVTSTGMLTAHYRTPLTKVVASLQVKGVTLADTAFVQVVATAPLSPLATFSMRPGPEDSAKVTIDSGYVYWPVTATNRGGTTVCDGTHCPFLIAYSTSNPDRVVVHPIYGHTSSSPRIVQFPDNAYFNFLNSGHVYFIAETWAYGDSLRDSVDFTVGLQLNIFNELTSTSGSSVSFSVTRKVTVGVGAVLTFQNNVPHPLDIVFNDPTGMDTASVFTAYQVLGPLPPTGTGNIPAFGGDTVCNTDSLTAYGLDPTVPYYCTAYKWLFVDAFRARRFKAPGVYRYWSSLGNSATYTIDVHDDR